MNHESVEMQSKSRKHAWSKVSVKTQIIVLLLLGILGYICIHLVGDSDFVQRRIFVRLWNCFVCGLLAIAGVHLLFLDADLFLVQAVNLNRWQLIAHQFRKFVVVLMLLALPPIVLVFYRINDFTVHFFDGIIIVAPVILLMDEPFRGLDDATQKTVLVQLQEFRNKGGILVVSSHMKSILETLCDDFLNLPIRA